MSENNETSEKKNFLPDFLTLHFSHGEKAGSFTLKKQYTAIIGGVCICFLAAGVFFCNSYISTKRELQASSIQLEETIKTKKQLEEKNLELQTQTKEYQENISEIQTKAAKIENKITELEGVKKELTDELNNISQSDPSIAPDLTSIASKIDTPPTEAPTFIPLVQTSFLNTAALSTTLEKLDEKIDMQALSFADVADNVTQTVSSLTSIPSGFPCNGRVTTEFNPTGEHSVSDGRVHKGTDIATKINTPIRATASGIVVEAFSHSSYGNMVKIDHGNGFTTLYAHNQSLNCEVGDKVKAGDIIAFAGSTGNSTGVHSHYEIMLNGIYQNARDY